MSLDVSDIAYGSSKDTWNCQRSVVFGYLTRVVLLVVKTSPSKRNGKPPVRPPATREGYQSCWKWSSPLGTSRCCFYIKCNVYDYLRVLFCIWYETKLSLACSTRVTVIIIRYCSRHLASAAHQWSYLSIDSIFFFRVCIYFLKTFKYGII